MIEDLTGRSFYGNTVLDYIIFSGAVLTGLALVTVLRKVLMPRIRTWAQQTESSLDDILVRILERAVVPLLYYGRDGEGVGLNASKARYKVRSDSDMRHLLTMLRETQHVHAG